MENIRQVLVQLVPAFVLNDIRCYTFYDNHPRDEKNIDLILCTKDREVQEYYKRDLVTSIKLSSTSKPSEIRILRSNQCELFYLVISKDEITILSRKDNLEVHQIVTNVDRYDINDISCSGQASLRVFCKGDAVPLIFDENFENVTRPDISTTVTAENDDTLPIITHLKRKLTEAKYSVKCNEKTYKDLLNIHQAVAFSTHKKNHPNLDDSVFKDGTKEMARALRINTQTPWIKVCNKKIVIALTVCNMNNEALEDVHILLHGTSKQGIEYTTKIFEKPDSSPFWEESKTQMLRYNVNSAVVVVIDLEEIKSNIVSKIELSGVIFYRQLQKECLLPIEDVQLSSLDTMGVDFDVLSSVPLDSNIMLAILATTEKTDLVLRHIVRSDDEALTLDIFCKYLLMERVPHCSNIAIHRQSPYHVLNGVMVVLHSETTNGNNCMMMSVYSRTQSQVLALIHYIHDAVPLSIVITPPNYKITAKDDSLSKHNEEILDETQLIYNYQNYATSILNRTGLVLKYLDDCMIKMSESKNPVVQTKIGTEIDLFAGGEAKYLKFKDRMRLEAASGVKQMNGDSQSVPKSEPEAMCVD